MTSPSTGPMTRELMTITRHGAQALVDAAIHAAAAQSINASVAVHDAGGNLVAFSRMDGALELTIDIAQNKSHTSAASGLATHQWHDFIKDDEPLRIGIVHTPRLVTFGGGIPIIVDGRPIGAIGVSGGHHTQDVAVATEALKACGFSV